MDIFLLAMMITLVLAIILLVTMTVYFSTYHRPSRRVASDMEKIKNQILNEEENAI